MILQPVDGTYGRIPAWHGRASWIDEIAADLVSAADAARAAVKVSRRVVLGVARVLARYAEPTSGRDVAPSNARIAERLGVSTRAVQRGMRVLEARGYVVTVVEGRYLTVAERARAAERTTGSRRPQIRAASTRALTSPQGPGARPKSRSVIPSVRITARSRTSPLREAIKRSRARKAGDNPVRPIELQRLAAALVERWTALGRHRHIGAVVQVLINARMPLDATASRILDGIEAANRRDGRTMPADVVDPVAMFAWLLERVDVDAFRPPGTISDRLARAGLPARRGECAHLDPFGHSLCVKCGDPIIGDLGHPSEGGSR